MRTDATKCTSEDLEVQVKMKTPVRFKAGAELSGKVNRVGVEVNEELNETSATFELKLVVSREACTYNPCEN